VRVDVKHTTRLDYSADVVEAVMDVRLGPLTDQDQRVEHFDVRVEPHGAVRRYTDGFGNSAHLISLSRPHTFVEVVAVTELYTLLEDPFRLPAQAPAALDPRTAIDSLRGSQLIALGEDIAALAAPYRSDDPGRAFEVAQGLMDRVHGLLSYRSSVTTVETRVDEVLRGRAGVCQDFAHLLIALARCLGLPARYVSGYIVQRLQTQTQSGQSQSKGVGPSRGAGASHAWAEVFTPTHGWRGFDPTNNLVANAHYVKVATGRDYHDVAPTRGTYRGQAEEHLTVGVSTRILG
jgi:transglutaminase-like putative cysteine protease